MVNWQASCLCQPQPALCDGAQKTGRGGEHLTPRPRSNCARGFELCDLVGCIASD
jgi:hypothetical protein